MEEITNNIKYLKIFKAESSWAAIERHTRSLEKYLEKNSHTFNIKDENYIVYVQDKNEAMRIAMDLQKHKKFEYFDGIELLPLIISQRPIFRDIGKRHSIIGKKSDKPITWKKFVEYSNDQIRSKCLNKTDIIKRGILTKGKFEKAVTDGKLTIIKFKSKCFIDRDELAEYIKSTF